MLVQAVVQLTYEGRSRKQPIYVLEDLKNNLLRLPVITALQLLTIESIQTKNVQQGFLKLFHGLGTLKGDYHIQLKPDAKPYALYNVKMFQYHSVEKLKKSWNAWRSSESYPKWTSQSFGVLEWWWFPKNLVMSIFVLI